MDYKDKLRLAKEALDSGSYDKETIEYIFPELKESEDEEVRKSIIAILNNYVDNSNTFKPKMLAWLEKQGNPTDINPSEFDLRLNTLLKQFESLPKEELASSLSFYLNVVQNDGTYREEKQGNNLVKNGYINNKDYIRYADKYSHNIWRKLMDNFKNIKDYHIGCNDVSDIVLNAIIDTFKWLEKDGDKNKVSQHVEASKEEKVDDANKVEPKDYNGIDPYFGKPVDKVEPKFKVGDWITNGATKPEQISSIEDDMYYTHNDTIGYDIESVDKDSHLWTIQDAKDGDVLAISWWEDNNFWEKIIIFKKYHNKGVKWLYCMPCVEGYGNTFKNGKLAFNEKVPYYSKTWTCNLHPATKEQRDLLFQKMKEAGYEWDAEKKELKKIEQKPTDKVVPKFKVGDWVVSPNGVYWHIDKISNNRYEVTSNTGESSNWPLDTNIYHKFTIQDAKKGDILACDKCILIFDQLSEFNNEQALMDICHCTSKGFYWQDTKDRDMWALDGFKPATKEQRDILFAKMHKAGYEWDTEKKELKKIEQKPTAWNGEDNTYYDDICEILINLIHSETAKVNKDVVQKDLDWLMSIQQRIETK